MLPECKHSPHRDQPEKTLKHMVEFVAEVRRAGGKVRAGGTTDRSISLEMTELRAYDYLRTSSE
jgi:uncharacterized protein with von Willebrand factor type A (vWA) domain